MISKTLAIAATVAAAALLTATAALANPVGMPASAEFSVTVCADTTDQTLHASATWTHADIDRVQFWAYVDIPGWSGETYGGEMIVQTDPKPKYGATSINWIPPLVTYAQESITTVKHLQVNFYSASEHWTAVIGLLDVASCA